LLRAVKKLGKWKGTKRNSNVKLIFAFSRGAGYDVSNTLQDKNIRFAFILGTETDGPGAIAALCYPEKCMD